MPKITFDKAARAKLSGAMSDYMRTELDLEVKGFDAEFLLDFISETLGPHYYNQGLQDAQELFRTKFEVVLEAVYELEQPVKGL
uniref:DUF2164 domain-containing protein n=1 Tax=uncultured Caulobacter sp. TaxID=158749 RepID=UPI0025EB9735|nr:DUF2164 domain-containing protein [uncultured Caulobacter sp.]